MAFSATGPELTASQPLPAPSSLLLHLRMDGQTKLKLSKLEPGRLLEGELSRAVYSGDREVFPAGSRARLVVDKVEQRKKGTRQDSRPFVVRIFAPKHEYFPSFRSASIILPDGSEIPVRASFIGLARKVEVRAKVEKPGVEARKAEDEEAETRAGGRLSGKSRSETDRKHKGGLTSLLVLQVESADVPFSAFAAATAEGPLCSPAASAGPITLAAGTPARLVLLQGLSASKNRPGDSFEARLVEPVRLGSRAVLPEGTLFEGHVANRAPPRLLSRPGTLSLTFTKLTLPTGAGVTIAASLAGAEVDEGPRMNMDSEGSLHGGGAGKKALLLDLGVASGIAKIADDSTQLIIEALVSTATDASTAGVARIVGFTVSALFLATRHGRDVILPKYTQMDLTFVRPVSLLDAPEPKDTGQNPRSEPAHPKGTKQ